MKKLIILSLCATILLSGCSNLSNEKNKENEVAQNSKVIIGEDFDKDGGADSYGNAGDNQDSKYYKNPDFYNMENGDGLVIIPKFKTFQQTTEWSCGNATTLMVLNHFGKLNETEYEIAEKMGSSTDLDAPGAKPGSANNFPEYGTDVEQITKYFEKRDDFKVLETSYQEVYIPENIITKEDGYSENDWGNLKPKFNSNALYVSDEAGDSENWVDDAKDSYFVKWLTDHLSNNRPIMVEWGDWDGHWQLIIGYDNNNTPGVGDDILIFADPYDTSDHLQDGYFIYSLERWFTMWKDRNVAPKPYQLQPFVVVETISQ